MTSFRKSAVERVLGIGTIEPLIPIAAARDEVGSFEFCELSLHGLKRKKRETRQLTHVRLLPRGS